jgi:hypothetical protein
MESAEVTAEEAAAVRLCTIRSLLERLARDSLRRSVTSKIKLITISIILLILQHE